MPSRILTVDELERVLSLEEPFRGELLGFYDYVNAQLADVAGVEARIGDCFRDTQAIEWAKGRKLTVRGWVVVDASAVTTNAPPGFSLHEFGEAGHIELVDATGAWLPDAHPRWRWLGEQAEAHGFIWGGRFRHPDGRPFFDASHLETKAGRSRAKARGWKGKL